MKVTEIDAISFKNDEAKMVKENVVSDETIRNGTFQVRASPWWGIGVEVNEPKEALLRGGGLSSERPAELWRFARGVESVVQQIQEVVVIFRNFLEVDAGLNKGGLLGGQFNRDRVLEERLRAVLDSDNVVRKEREGQCKKCREPVGK